jgi:hypothetical protein
MMETTATAQRPEALHDFVRRQDPNVIMIGGCIPHRSDFLAAPRLSRHDKP